MTKFSANLGFLWNDVPLPKAITAAKAAGFDAVECHWPYDTPAEDVKSALEKTGMTMLGINTRRGNVEAGENGLSAMPGREAEARAAIDEAIAYAHGIGTPNVHVMCGVATGSKAHATFIANLHYACVAAAGHGITILIEPLNQYDVPGYFLNKTVQAVSIIEEISKPNLKLMFDCYHVQIMEGDLTHRLQRLLPLIGHIQFASVPGRGAPNMGEVNYPYIFEAINQMGYTAPLGAEYKVEGDTESTLGWLSNAE